MGGKNKILIVDDHAVFREGLSRVLQQEKTFEICGEATDAADALKKADQLKPDLVIVDISLEGMNGVDLTKALRARHPHIRILVLSMHKESIYAERSLRAGANGYIMKKESSKELLNAIRRVLQGFVYVSEEMNDQLLHRVSTGGKDLDGASVDRLSDRELEVFHLIGEGYGTRQIAEKLILSMKTVEAHREHIRSKFNLNSTFELVQQAIHWVHHESMPR